ncbi:MAG: FKBP-type peptidyl-prolyl cis-trans isomerase [Planctomycetota bacterium]
MTSTLRRTVVRLAAAGLLAAAAVAFLPPLQAVTAQNPPAAEIPPPAAIGTPAANGTRAAAPPLETFEQQVSYTLGLNVGSNFLARNIPVQIDSLVAGITDALARAQPKLTDAQRITVIRQLEQRLQREARQLMAANLQRGKAFLAANAKKPGVQTTASGLQYKVLAQGTGPSPNASSVVKCHYEGRLLDGTVFDSSYARGEPTLFPLGRVISGWTEAVQLMKVGGKWELYIPGDLAYGLEGQPPSIGPNQTLLFTIELLGIEQ